MTILNSPYQDGAYESPEHMKAKIAVAKCLSDAGYVVEYEVQWRTYPDQPKPFRSDIYLPAHQYCIEIDGSTHDSKGAKSKDRWKDDQLKQIGKHTIRMTIEEALDMPEQILPRIPKPLRDEPGYNRIVSAAESYVHLHDPSEHLFG